MAYAIGIDVGGTFTDLVACDENGTTTLAKAATTPQDQSAGVLNGLGLLAEALGLALPELLRAATRIVHGTTVATNALLEGRGARVAMLTTAGHRDVIEMREGLKPDRYNLRLPPPTPLVPLDLRLTVTERLRADGSVHTPLDPASLDVCLDSIAGRGIEAVAICFLHAWKNAAHEQEAAARVRARFPEMFVTCSHEVLPVIKEYERFSTAVANALVGPLVRNYLGRLEQRLRSQAYAGPLYIILSHGGVASADAAVALAAGTALSGPAGGVAAAVSLSRAGAGDDLITFDMGGTSTDIAVLQGGRPFLSGGKNVGEARIALPSLEITTLGAGGGSIAHLDRSGLLQVGPQSAGAVPGPACYGAGGDMATVTDANLALGYLDATSFLGGRRRLDADASRRAIGCLGASLGLGETETAFGIHRLVNSRMADGLRLATVRKGIDPQSYTLLSFGGAAGLHVCAVAAELGMSRVLVPLEASVLSAWGMLGTDLRVELMQSLDQGGRMDPGALDEAFERMIARGKAQLAQTELHVGVQTFADMRYGEQVFEITVPLDGIDATSEEALAEAFHRRHETLFTYALREQKVVLVNARASIIGALAPLERRAAAQRERRGAGQRKVFLGRGWDEIPVHEFETLGPEERIAGPAIVESQTTTILLRDGDSGQLGSGGWLEIDLTGPGRAS